MKETLEKTKDNTENILVGKSTLGKNEIRKIDPQSVSYGLMVGNPVNKKKNKKNKKNN